jgi:hypothetical protein
MSAKIARRRRIVKMKKICRDFVVCRRLVRGWGPRATLCKACLRRRGADRKRGDRLGERMRIVCEVKGCELRTHADRRLYAWLERLAEAPYPSMPSFDGRAIMLCDVHAAHVKHWTAVMTRLRKHAEYLRDLLGRITAQGLPEGLSLRQERALDDHVTAWLLERGYSEPIVALTGLGVDTRGFGSEATVRAATTFEALEQEDRDAAERLDPPKRPIEARMGQRSADLIALLIDYLDYDRIDYPIDPWTDALRGVNLRVPSYASAV